ncbi:MAG: sulfatase/phosphatase domain-containing protein, partial [Promethearchaeota archaeon]
RIPFIWRVPGTQKGKVATEQIGSLIDIAPTILEFLEINIPQHIQGQSLAPIISGEAETLEKNYTFIESMYQGAAIRTPKHIFGKRLNLENGQLTNRRTIFYDLENDPFEYENLAETAKEKEIKDKLEAILVRWNADTPWGSTKS